MTEASLHNLLDPRYHDDTERYEAFQAGGGGKVKRREVVFLNAEAAGNGGGGLAVTFLRDGGSVEGSVHALGLPADWSGFDHAALELTNGDQPATVQFVVLGARCRLIDRRELAPGERARLEVDLVDLPLAQGVRPPHEPAGVRVVCQWGDTWRNEGERILNNHAWPRTDGNAPQRLELHRLALVPSPDRRPRPCVDRYGQRVNGEWPTKVRDERHARDVVAEEEAWLARQPPHPDRNRFGGWTGAGPRFEAGGFFRVEQDAEGRWWYVDPDGCPFWSIGTTGVRTTDCTVVAGREWLFEELPARDGLCAAAYNPPVVSPANDAGGREAIAFYRLNVLRKWGSLERWCEQVTRRFRAWGFNTIGNWSEAIMLRQRAVPHTRALSSRLPGAPTVARRMPDVWDAGWEPSLRAAFGRELEGERDNPWLLGCFCDNEMPWGGLHRNLLDCGPGSAAREAFIAFMRARYGSLAAFNRDFGRACATWDDLRALSPDDVPAEGPAAEAMHALVGEYAERYFRTVAAAFRAADPHHLYLGCRFVRRRPHDLVCVAAGRHCDVVTVNMYDLWPRREEFEPWHVSCGRRPIQIGEHHLPLFGPRQLPPLYPAFTEEQRRRLYYELVMKWADQPYALGCHWYQHADQHITGRPNDGENQPVGFVDIADRPYPELGAAAREATARMYDWHARGMSAREDHPDWARSQ